MEAPKTHSIDLSLILGELAKCDLEREDFYCDYRKERSILVRLIETSIKEGDKAVRDYAFKRLEDWARRRTV